MFKTKVIKHSVFVDFNMLDNNLEETIKSRIISPEGRLCTKEYGYVMKINKIISYSDNMICRNMPKVCFNIIFEAQVYKPKKGKKISICIKCITSNGILCCAIQTLDREEYDFIAIFIPKTVLENYTFDPSNKTFTNEESSLKEGDTRVVIITDVFYEKKGFVCLAKIK